MKGWIIIHENNLSMNFHDRQVYTNLYEAEFEALRQIREIIRNEVWNWKTYKGLSGNILCSVNQHWRVTSDGFRNFVFLASEEYDEYGFVEHKMTEILLREVEF